MLFEMFSEILLTAMYFFLVCLLITTAAVVSQATARFFHRLRTYEKSAAPHWKAWKFSTRAE